jgi:Mrp family chromosome partitioning ATPase
MGINAAPGLCDYLVSRAEPREVLQSIAPPGGSSNGSDATAVTTAIPFVAISAGSPSPHSAELLRSQRCREFLGQVRDAYDIVILDTCPLLSVADTLEQLSSADAVVLCVRASKTTRDQARAASAALSHFPSRPAGVVLTGSRVGDDSGYQGYYSYGYVYGSGRS